MAGLIGNFRHPRTRQLPSPNVRLANETFAGRPNVAPLNQTFRRERRFAERDHLPSPNGRPRNETLPSPNVASSKRDIALRTVAPVERDIAVAERRLVRTDILPSPNVAPANEDICRRPNVAPRNETLPSTNVARGTREQHLCRKPSPRGTRHCPLRTSPRRNEDICRRRTSPA